MSDLTKSYLRRRRRPGREFLFLAVSAAGLIALIGIAWQVSKNGAPTISILGTSDPVDRALRKWFDENEGEPRSVEIISKEIRIRPAGQADPFHNGQITRWPRLRLLRVKYRHKAFLGPVVTERILDISDGAVQEVDSEIERRSYAPNWDRFERE